MMTTKMKTPKNLLNNCSDKRVAIVVGSKLGGSSWKELLESLNLKLKDKGQEAPYKDVAKLLENKEYARAAAFLGRVLGAEVCDAEVKMCWADKNASNDFVKAIANCPIAQVWTTYPGEVVENVAATVNPDWPAPDVKTYLEAGEIYEGRRTLLKLTGDYNTFLASPSSFRQVFNQSNTLVEFIKPFYEEGTLLFVGFENTDPDFIALKEKLFSRFAYPQKEHFWIGEKLDLVSKDELQTEHRIAVLDSNGQNDAQFIEQLAKDLAQNGKKLLGSTPEPSDVQGWALYLNNNPGDKKALSNIDGLIKSAQEAKDMSVVEDLMLIKVESIEDDADKANALWGLGKFYQDAVGNNEDAFTAYTASLVSDPSQISRLDAIEKLAQKVNGWNELCGDVSGFVEDINDKNLRGTYWAKLGSWYQTKLSRMDYAESCFKQGAAASPGHPELLWAASELYRAQNNWGSLADTLNQLVNSEELSEDKRIDVLLSLGELYESQLSSTLKAEDAFKKCAKLPNGEYEGLLALQRLYRKNEKWSDLAEILDARMTLANKRNQIEDVQTIKKELSHLRKDQITKVDDSIEALEASLADDPQNVDVLKQLESAYDKAGRHQDYLRTVRALGDNLVGPELTSLLRRYVAELEEDSKNTAEIESVWFKLIQQPDARDDDFRGALRWCESHQKWERAVAVVDLQLKNKDIQPAQKAELYLKWADLESHLHHSENTFLCLEKAIECDRGSFKANKKWFDFLVKEKQWEKAIKAGMRLIENDQHQGSESKLTHTAWAAFEASKNSKNSQDLLTALLKLDPQFMEAFVVSAKIAESEKSWKKAIRWHQDMARLASSRVQKAETLSRAAWLADKELDHVGLATELYEEVIALEPEHVEGCRYLSKQYAKSGMLAKAAPLLEELSSIKEGVSNEDAATHLANLGTIYNDLGDFAKAKSVFKKASGLNPQNTSARLGLMLLSVEETGHTTKEKWRAIAAECAKLAAGEGKSWSKSEALECKIQQAKAEFKADLRPQSLKTVKDVLALDGSNQEAWQLLSEIKKQAGEMEGYADVRSTIISRLSPAGQYKEWLNLGDELSDKAGAETLSLEKYQKALAINPTSRTVLHKMLNVYSKSGNWEKAVSTLDKMVAIESNPLNRAKYLYTSAVIYRDEMKLSNESLSGFSKALDENPNHPKAMKAIDSILSTQGDWKKLSKKYRNVIKKTKDKVSVEAAYSYWGRLGQISYEELGDQASAMTAWEVAAELRPSQTEWLEKLVDLQIEAGQSHRKKAIKSMQTLLRMDPSRTEIYRGLFQLYLKENELDKAYCCAQALDFLGLASAEEKKIVAERKKDSKMASGQITDELWQSSIADRRENRIVDAIFSSLAQPLAMSKARNVTTFQFEDRTASPTTQASKVFEYACKVLSPAVKPSLVIDDKQPSAMQVANTKREGQIAPTVVLGKDNQSLESAQELAFSLGKKMTYLRPEKFLSLSAGTAPQMEEVLFGALKAANVDVKISNEMTGDSAQAIKNTVSKPVLDYIGKVAGQLNDESPKGIVQNWLEASELTANRAGFILCDDLHTAAKMVAKEKGPSFLTKTEQLQELLAYSVSEDYFALRSQLGLQ